MEGDHIGDREDLLHRVDPRAGDALLALALQEVLGQMVGYQIRFEKARHSRETTVGYLTYGTALRIFCGNPPKSDDIVIFDEVRWRTMGGRDGAGC